MAHLCLFWSRPGTGASATDPRGPQKHAFDHRQMQSRHVETWWSILRRKFAGYLLTVRDRNLATVRYLMRAARLFKQERATPTPTNEEPYDRD
eukprot:9343029-Karenia_brevis.AAC.1